MRVRARHLLAVLVSVRVHEGGVEVREPEVEFVVPLDHIRPAALAVHPPLTLGEATQLRCAQPVPRLLVQVCGALGHLGEELGRHAVPQRLLVEAALRLGEHQLVHALEAAPVQIGRGLPPPRGAADQGG